METKDRREKLFQHLDLVLRRAEKKFKIDRGQRESLNLKWGRLIVQAVLAYGRLLETEELEERVAKIEEQLKNGVLIPVAEESKKKAKRY